MAYNETISSAPKLNAWQKIKKVVGNAYNTVSDAGEKYLPWNIQGSEERSLKKQVQDNYSLTPAFSKFVQDQPVKTGVVYKEPTKGGQWSLPNMKYNLFQKMGSLAADAVNEVGVKVDNPAVTKVADYLVNKYYDTIDNQVANRKGGIEISSAAGYPYVMAHESLHGWYKNKMQAQGVKSNSDQMSIVPFSTKFNSTWDKLKKDGRIGPILDTIDSNLASSALYKDIQKDPYTLANERYAYLGGDPNISTYTADYPELNSLYGDAFVPKSKASVKISPFYINPFVAGGSNQQTELKQQVDRATKKVVEQLVKKRKLQ